MAKGSKRDVMEVRPVWEYTLTLTQAEAEALRAVFHFVGGDSEVSPRRQIDNVDRVLENLGVPATGTHAYRCIRERNSAMRGIVYFYTSPSPEEK